MSFSGLAYVLFTVLLAIISGGIIAYYYNPKRKQNTARPCLRFQNVVHMVSQRAAAGGAKGQGARC